MELCVTRVIIMACMICGPRVGYVKGENSLAPCSFSHVVYQQNDNSVGVSNIFTGPIGPRCMFDTVTSGVIMITARSLRLWEG